MAGIRRMRNAQEMRLDPRYDYMVGRLVGACEMMAHYMFLHGDENAKQMGARVLGGVLEFFVDDPEDEEGSRSLFGRKEIERSTPSE